MSSPACDAAHAFRYTESRPATIDLGRHIQIVGLPGVHRFLCDDCARGRIYPLDRYRIKKDVTA